MLQPYTSWPGPVHSHRVIRSLLAKHYTTPAPHEIYPSPSKSVHYPLLHTYPFVQEVGTYWNKRHLTGHYFVVPHPAETVSVLEPGGDGGCAKPRRSTVQTTAATQRCLLATNAGFFNTTSGACIGEDYHCPPIDITT